MRRVISVIGASEVSQNLYSLAEKIGFELAKMGIVIVCGGRGGVMEAVCKGAHFAGGISVGILPGDASEANPYVTIPIPTFLGEARNALVVSAGQVVLAIGGGIGTLSEIALALKMQKPVIALNSWTAEDYEGNKLPLIYVNNVEEALQKVKELLALR